MSFTFRVKRFEDGKPVDVTPDGCKSWTVYHGRKVVVNLRDGDVGFGVLSDCQFAEFEKIGEWILRAPVIDKRPHQRTLKPRRNPLSAFLRAIRISWNVFFVAYDDYRTGRW